MTSTNDESDEGRTITKPEWNDRPDYLPGEGWIVRCSVCGARVTQPYQWEAIRSLADHLEMAHFDPYQKMEP